MVNIKFLFAILNSNPKSKIKSIFDKNKVNLKVVTHGIGTASPSVLDYFGLVETKKDIYMAVIPDYLENKILNNLNKEFKIDAPGTGIAFTVPISSSNKFISQPFEKDANTKEVAKMTREKKYHLVITIVVEGHLEQVMNAAKRVGASGGTVIRGRGLGNKEAVKLFGFEIEPGRELVLNVVEDSIKNKVMEEITKEVGIKTPGKGVCIALPVDSAVGFK
ncbi:MAG: P-II family nitrogen regulator [Bacilli bacterium]|nr:P-II family nitrogen regulator [Bacilli bacterium]